MKTVLDDLKSHNIISSQRGVESSTLKAANYEWSLVSTPNR